MKPKGARHQRALAGMYLDAKRAVIEAGFAWEADWQAGIDLAELTESAFLREAAWVILSSGMRESIVRKHFPEISRAFLDWRSALAITDGRKACRRRALAVFNHRAKINAIIAIAGRVASASFDWVRDQLASVGVRYVHTFPFMGPATALHLAKNIGLPVAKPDRHLSRIANTLQIQSVETMCTTIAEFANDPIPVVDVVLWRFATINQHYTALLRSLYDVQALRDA